MTELKTIIFKPGPLVDDLARRANRPGLSPHQVAKRDLGRYYAVLCDSLPAFTAAEAGLLVQALKDSRLDAQSYRYLPAAVAESAPGLAKQWKVEPDDLDRKLKRLPPGARAAVLDAVERFWLMVAADKNADTRELLKEVGLCA